MSSKTNNLANTHPIKHSLRTHTALIECWLNPPIQNRFRGFGLHNSAYCCQPWPASPLLYTGMGTSVAVAQRQILSFALAWQRVIVQLGPLMVMSFLGALESEHPLESWLLSSYALPQVVETQRSGRLGEGTISGSFGPENQRSIICQELGNDYTMAAPSHFSFFLSSRSFPFVFVMLWCLSYYMNSSSKLFDQVVWPTTRSRRVVNVSMCLLLCTLRTLLKRINGPRMKL